MQTIWVRLIASVFVYLFAAVALATEIAVVAVVEGRGKDLSLAFAVSNMSAIPKKTIETRLPWGYSPSLLLVASPKGGGLLPNAQKFVEIPSNMETVVLPGKTVTGRVLLQHRFGDALIAALRTGPVLLVWACRSPFDDDTYFSGHVVIPKTET